MALRNTNHVTTTLSLAIFLVSKLLTFSIKCFILYKFLYYTHASNYRRTVKITELTDAIKVGSDFGMLSMFA